LIELIPRVQVLQLFDFTLYHYVLVFFVIIKAGVAPNP